MKVFGYDIRVRKSSVTKSRNYSAAQSGRLTSDWLTTNLAADEVLRWALPTMRNRSRDLAMNNDHMKNFLRKTKVNTIGPKGITMQSKVRTPDGNLDKPTNTAIEAAWKKWCKKQYASVCGTQSLKDMLNTTMDTVPRDGEVFIRKVRNYDNPFKFALQLIEADHVDTQLNSSLPNGNYIRMGIERNPWGKPAAVYAYSKHPGENMAASDSRRIIRIPAEEIIHPFVKERPTQTRGIPWAHTAIIRLRMLGAYEEASLVSARVGASKMGFFTRTNDAGDYQGDDTDDKGNLITEIEPGLLEELPVGVDFKGFDPGQPSGEFQPFQKAMLRGVAAGIGSSYNSLTSDLEGVNFSSLRSGAIEERDNWKVIQQWVIENILDDIFPDWLEMAILSGQLRLPYSNISRLIEPQWQARTWDWVDPLKDVNARKTELETIITSRTRICAEKGIDFEDLLEEIAEEQAMMKEYGVELPEQTDTASLIEPDEDDKDNKDKQPAAAGNNGKTGNGRRHSI